MIDFQFGSLGELLMMGNHGKFVWSAYGIGVVNFLIVLLALRSFEKKVFGRIQSINNRDLIK